MWVLIDNYDSFTYILHHYLLQTGHDCTVYRNDDITVAQLKEINPDRLIISPGPETPLQAGICMDAIAHFHSSIPILGVCLGHQALGMHFGAKLVHTAPMHGKTCEVNYTPHPLFTDMPQTFTVMRYHSLALQDIEGNGLLPIAYANDGVNMALVHETYPCTGIQFHPESIGTPQGLQLLKNWAAMYR